MESPTRALFVGSKRKHRSLSHADDLDSACGFIGLPDDACLLAGSFDMSGDVVGLLQVPENINREQGPFLGPCEDGAGTRQFFNAELLGPEVPRAVAPAVACASSESSENGQPFRPWTPGEQLRCVDGSHELGCERRARGSRLASDLAAKGLCR